MDQGKVEIVELFEEVVDSCEKGWTSSICELSSTIDKDLWDLKKTMMDYRVKLIALLDME